MAVVTMMMMMMMMMMMNDIECRQKAVALRLLSNIFQHCRASVHVHVTSIYAIFVIVSLSSCNDVK